MDVILEKGLEFLVTHPEAAKRILDSEIEMPNIPFPTMGGEVFWTTLAEFN